MEIYNLMVEQVIDIVDEIFKDADYIKETGCSNSDDYKTDVACYVLNRIPPLYTTSSRGLSHLGTSVIDKPQNIADITALVHVAIKQIGSRRSPDSGKTPSYVPEPPIFNFPILKGKVMDGKTFAPYAGTSIMLKINGIPALMNGERWSNPCPLIYETDGRFIFWPIPLKADDAGESREFSIAFELSAKGYKPVRHYIDLTLTSENNFINSAEENNVLKVDPIYLFKADEPEEIVTEV